MGNRHVTQDDPPGRFDRRHFLRGAIIAGGGLAAGRLLGATPTVGAQASEGMEGGRSALAPAFNIARSGRLVLANGLQAGDVNDSSAVVWARADRPARLIVDWSTTYTFDGPTPLGPLIVGPDTDFTGKLYVSQLPRGQRVFYRVRLEDLSDASSVSEPEIGSFVTPPRGFRDITFAFTGDNAGQGWGINPDWGGMRCWETMRQQQPDFYIHSGDSIYADRPLVPEVKLPDGTVWRNIVTPEKSKVAETLDEFRGNFRDNVMDENVQRFNAEVAAFAQWDDHEVVNNWYPGEVLDYRASEYTVERRVDVLAARAKRAFFEYWPIRPGGDESGRV